MRYSSGKARIPEAALTGVVTAVLLLTLVLTAYVRLYETVSENAALEEELETVQARQEELQAAYELAADPQRVYQEATGRLGMTEPEAWQMRTVTLPLQDRGEILTVRTPSALENFKTNLQAAAADILSYFS